MPINHHDQEITIQELMKTLHDNQMTTGVIKK